MPPIQKNQAGAPTGIRTPVLAVRGLRPRPLDDEGKVTFLAPYRLFVHATRLTKKNFQT